jgi:hypothetical protein
MSTLTISGYKLANVRSYRGELLGQPVTYTTPAGTEVVGTITEHPMHAGGLRLAVTTPEGKWASIGPNDTLTVRNA